MALSDRRVAQTLLEFKIARGEIEQARRSITTLAAGYEELDEIARNTDRILTKGAGSLSRFSQVTKGQAVPNVRDLRDAIDEAAEAQERLNDGQSKGIRLLPGANLRPNLGRGGGGGAGGLQPLGQAANAARGLGLGGAAQGLNVADDLLDAGRALVQLGPAGAIAAAAMVGMGIAIDQFTKQIEAGKQGLSGALTAQTAYYQALQSGTVESITEQLKGFNARRTFLEQQIGETQNAIDETFAQAAATFGDAAARALDAAGQLPTAQLREQLETLNTEYQTNIQTTDRLTVAVNSTEVATRSANEAFVELTKTQQEFTDRIFGVQIRTLIQSTSLTTEGIRQRLEAIDREQEVLQEFIAAGNLSAEATEELQLRLADLGVEESTLTMRVQGLVEASEIAASKEQMLIDARTEAAANLDKVVQDIRKVEGEISQIEAGLAAKVAELAAARQAAEEKALADRNEAIADAERDAAESRAEAQVQAAKDSEKLELDHQRNIQKILRQFNRSAEQAIQDRDAVALDAAQRARDEALEDETTSHDDRKKEINARLKETNKEIDKRLVEQRNNAIKRYNEQVRAAQQHEQAQLKLARDAAQADINQKRAYLQQLQAQEQAYRAAALGLQKNFLDAMLQLARNAVGSVSGLGSGKPNIPPAGGTPPKLPNVPPKFAGGADVYRSGLAVVHAGEKILNRQQQAASGMGTTISIPVTIQRGMSQQEIEREVLFTLRAALRKAG